VHDIGKVYVDRYIEQFSVEDPFACEGDSGEIPHCQIEKNAFGVDHADIGAAVVQRWGFAPLVVDLTAYHHDAKNYESPEMKALQLANQIAKTIGRTGGAKLSDQEASQLLRDLGLDKDDFEKIRNRSRSKLTKLAGTLK